MAFYSDISRSNVKLTGGFWKTWRENARDKGLMSVYDRFSETGRFGADMMVEIHNDGPVTFMLESRPK